MPLNQLWGTWNVYAGALWSGAYLYIREDVDDQGYFEIDGVRMASKPYRGRLIYRIRVKPKFRLERYDRYVSLEEYKAIWGVKDAA